MHIYIYIGLYLEKSRISTLSSLSLVKFYYVEFYRYAEWFSSSNKNIVCFGLELDVSLYLFIF